MGARNRGWQCCLLAVVTSLMTDAANADESLALQVERTPAGVRFGVFGKAPSQPAPTLVVLALDLERMAQQPVYSEIGKRLAQQGWLTATLDPPCHGEDLRDDEPAELAGWAARLTRGENFIEPFVARARAVLDELVARGWTDPARVAAAGTSRGGFLALQLAAAEPRVQAVVGFAPVTELGALREFQGLPADATAALDVGRLAPPLARRAVWLTIGNHDERVSTAACIRAAQAVASAAVAEGSATPPRVWLEVQPSAGHAVPEGAHARAAEWLARQVPAPSAPGQP